MGGGGVLGGNVVNKVYIPADVLWRMERRRYLALAGSGLTVIVAGCIGGGDGGDEENGNDTNGTDGTDNGSGGGNNNGTLPGYPSDDDNETDGSGGNGADG